MQGKKLTTDILWSVSALVMMNGVLQIFVYPRLSSYFGTEAFGNVLYVMGILAIFAPSIGLSVNNTRLVQRCRADIENGDCLLAIFLQLLPATLIFLLVVRQYLATTGQLALAVILLIATTLRYYGDVEYRMTLRYKRYFLYYGFISVGYLAGVLLFGYTKDWLLVFTLGEIACGIYLLFRGSVYRPVRLSAQMRPFVWHSVTLTCSYVLYNGVLNVDRILLQKLVGGSAVTVYYVASLLGKTLALLVGPLNGVVIGYLTKGRIVITRKVYALAAGMIALFSAGLYGAISVVTPWFARTFYGAVAEEIIKLAPVANLSQIACFSSSLLLTVMLTFCDEKWQLSIQGLYAVTFVLTSMLGARINGVAGFTMACLTVNVLRFILVVSVGMGKSRGGKDMPYARS